VETLTAKKMEASLASFSRRRIRRRKRKLNQKRLRKQMRHLRLRKK
jgi:hypothetical protein